MGPFFRFCVLLACVSVSIPDGYAGRRKDKTVDPMASWTPAMKAAEYQRLSKEIKVFAERQTWVAVERNYVRCLEIYPDPKENLSGWNTSSPIAPRVHLAGARAAQSRGDPTLVRQRLTRAFTKDDSNIEVLDWLWSVDNTYSKADIKAPMGTEFAAVEPPFDPTLARAVAIAAKQLRETGVFVGLLPRLQYTVGGQAFEVRGGVGVNQLDLSYGITPQPDKRKKGRRR